MSEIACVGICEWNGDGEAKSDCWDFHICFLYFGILPGKTMKSY